MATPRPRPIRPFLATKRSVAVRRRSPCPPALATCARPTTGGPRQTTRDSAGLGSRILAMPRARRRASVNARKPEPSMVRTGSSVRVRQRALPENRGFLKAAAGPIMSVRAHFASIPRPNRIDGKGSSSLELPAAAGITQVVDHFRAGCTFVSARRTQYWHAPQGRGRRWACPGYRSGTSVDSVLTEVVNDLTPPGLAAAAACRDDVSASNLTRGGVRLVPPSSI
jgi:hypothetical protein